MFSTVVLSRDSAQTAGILLLALVAVEYGGTYMLRIVRGRVPLTEFQKNFSRAGHAHAGVLVILSLLAVILVDATHLHGLPSCLARNAIPVSAILMPAGFFLSSVGRNREQPNGLIALLYLGVLSLTAGAVSLGIGLLQA